MSAYVEGSQEVLFIEIDDKVIVGIIKILADLMRNNKPITQAVRALLLAGDVSSL